MRDWRDGYFGRPAEGPKLMLCLGLLFAILLSSCACSGSPSAATPGAVGGKGALASLSVGLVANARLGLAYPLTPAFLPPSALAGLELDEEEGILVVPASDARFGALQAKLPELAVGAPYTAYLPDGSRRPAEVAGAALFLAACDRLAVAPLLALEGELPEEGSALLLAPGAPAEERPKSAPPPAPSREAEGALRAFFSAAPLPGRAPLGRQAFYSIPLELDGDPGEERFAARASYEPLGDAAARAALLEGYLLDERGGQLHALERWVVEVPQEELGRFSPQGGWELLLEPPVMASDIDGDSRAEVLRRGPEGYSLWSFDGSRLTPVGVGYQAVCD